eukprot:gene17093-20910_t
MGAVARPARELNTAPAATASSLPSTQPDMADALHGRDFLAIAGATTAVAPSGAMAQVAAADAGMVYANDQILTMEGDAFATVGAVAVCDGRILFGCSREA